MVAHSIDRRSTAGRLLDLVFELHDQKRISRVEAETIIELAEQGWSTEVPAPQSATGGKSARELLHEVTGGRAGPPPPP